MFIFFTFAYIIEANILIYKEKYNSQMAVHISLNRQMSGKPNKQFVEHESDR